MNIKQYEKTYGRKGIETLAEKSGTTFAYVMQIYNGIRRPSVELAERLVKASGNELDFVSLLTQKKSA
jgi:transcriptional regulator with XRE-family HTH domain